MKLYGDITNDVDLNNITNIQDFHIEEPHKVILTILDNAYSNPMEAMVREICQNASEVDDNFTVHLPTDLEPWFSVVDNGTGMSPEDCLRYGAGVGASTKDEDNDKVGGFGIGMKVPFTVSDQYLVISRWHGVEYTFNAFKDEHGLPKFVQTSDRQTDKPNGIEVQVPIESREFNKTKQALLKVLEYFKNKPKTNVDVDWPVTEYSVEGTGYSLVASRGGEESSWRGPGSRIVMGNLWYELTDDSVRENYGDDYAWIIECGLDLFMPIGSVQLPLSREAVLYTPATIKLIRQKLDVVISELNSRMQAELKAQPNIYAACKFMAESSNLMRRSKHTYYYEGQKANTVMNVYDIPSDKVYEIEPSRFRLKSLNLQNFQTKGALIGGAKDGVCLVYSKKALFLLMVNEEESKRVPSRLLRHVKETYPGDEGYPRVFLFSYTSTTKAKVKRWVYTTFGVKPDIFEDEVNEYKTVKGLKGTRKKIAKVKILRGVGYNARWDDLNNDLDLDNEEGVYVDLRRNDIISEKHRHWDIRTVQDTLSILSLLEVSPPSKIKPLYGCPGSYKNQLASHPNFMSLDEAVDKANETCIDTLTVAQRTRFNYLHSLNSYMNGEEAMFKLDINVKGSYYNSYRQRLEAYNSKIKKTKEYEQYELGRQLAKSIIDLDSTMYYNYEEQMEEKFKKKYPMLTQVHNSMRYTTENEEALLLKDIQEYVLFKTTSI